MKIYLFYHSVISDWNHGNAHFLRGITSSLLQKGHQVKIFEPEDGWSLQNLLRNHGKIQMEHFLKLFPNHTPEFYSINNFDPSSVLQDADLVIVHEWNDHKLVKKIGEYKTCNNHFILLFHDTHHRALTKPEEIANYDLRNYDGVLAFGEVIKNIYLKNGWVKHAWTWHEAADTSVFYPNGKEAKEGDLVWIGNWGDGERTRELQEFIINPVKKLGIKATFYGVRYPNEAIKLLEKANIRYKGWIPNYQVNLIFSKYKVTVHVPRRPYAEHLPGIPTIRPFEAMASGIPLICSPWKDSQNLFTEGEDYLVAENGEQMKSHLYNILNDKNLSDKLVNNAWHTIQSRHTCNYRAEELILIVKDIKRKLKNYAYE